MILYILNIQILYRAPVNWRELSKYLYCHHSRHFLILKYPFETFGQKPSAPFIIKKDKYVKHVIGCLQHLCLSDWTGWVSASIGQCVIFPIIENIRGQSGMTTMMSHITQL